jgi:hypothetical protein
MSIFSRISEAASLTRLMSRADAIVLQLTGNNPKHFHPSLYRHLLDHVKAHYDEQAFIEAAPLVPEEAALIMLTLLYGGSAQSASINSLHRPAVYKSAIELLRVKMQGSIRPSVSLWAFANTPSTQDYVPNESLAPTVDAHGLSGAKIGQEATADAINRVTGVAKDQRSASTYEDVMTRPKAPLTEQQIAEIKARHNELRKKWGD